MSFENSELKSSTSASKSHLTEDKGNKNDISDISRAMIDSIARVASAGIAGYLAQKDAQIKMKIAENKHKNAELRLQKEEPEESKEKNETVVMMVPIQDKILQVEFDAESKQMIDDKANIKSIKQSASQCFFAPTNQAGANSSSHIGQAAEQATTKGPKC